MLVGAKNGTVKILLLTTRTILYNLLLCATCRGMSVNDVLDQLEQENFFTADIYMLPPEMVKVTVIATTVMMKLLYPDHLLTTSRLRF